MKKRQNESGTANLPIIIALVALVLGLVGFVVWQNFLKAKPAATSAGSITIKEWGIKGTDSNAAGLAYKYKTISGINYVGFTNPALEANNECAGGIGRIQRLAPNDLFYDETGRSYGAAKGYYPTAPNAAKAHVGDYYYFYNLPQQTCAYGNKIMNDAENQVTAATKAFLESATTK